LTCAGYTHFARNIERMVWILKWAMMDQSIERNLQDTFNIRDGEASELCMFDVATRRCHLSIVCLHA
jgi:hypothetical protein